MKNNKDKTGALIFDNIIYQIDKDRLSDNIIELFDDVEAFQIFGTNILKSMFLRKPIETSILISFIIDELEECEIICEEQKTILHHLILNSVE